MTLYLPSGGAILAVRYGEVVFYSLYFLGG